MQVNYDTSLSVKKFNNLYMTARDNQFYDAIPIILVNLIKATYINTSSIHGRVRFIAFNRIRITNERKLMQRVTRK